MFAVSFPSPHETAVWQSATVAKKNVFPLERTSSSPKVLDLDGCVSREKHCHDQGDSFVWTGPQ